MLFEFDIEGETIKQKMKADERFGNFKVGLKHKGRKTKMNVKECCLIFEKKYRLLRRGRVNSDIK